ncbi:MAG: transglutaminase domain-containing protein [Leptospiraceae bacterium]|nr:transglutaminase domain-containing protein [Leptospiraceae bacterium]
MLSCLVTSSLRASPDKTGVRKLNPAQHRLVNRIALQNNGYTASKVVIILAYPQSNHYQDLNSFRPTAGAEILSAKNSGAKYVRFTVTGNDLPGPGETREIGYEADLTLYELEPDFTAEPSVVLPGKRIEALKKPDRYDKTVLKQLRYFTESNLPYVDPNHSAIKGRGRMVMKKSGGSILRYAQNIYDYTSRAYRYLNPNTGIHPIDQIIQNGGGDCGNLSSIFISLMRTQAVPARHLVGIRADNNFHAWAEFYHPRYGWIPVDVTYKNSNQRGDYFGRIASRDKAIILHPDVNLIVEKAPGQSFTAPILQGFYWWVWGQGSVDGKLVPEQRISVQPL